jgi:hypothetical protein
VSADVVWYKMIPDRICDRPPYLPRNLLFYLGDGSVALRESFAITPHDGVLTRRTRFNFDSDLKFQHYPAGESLHETPAKTYE